MADDKMLIDIYKQLIRSCKERAAISKETKAHPVDLNNVTPKEYYEYANKLTGGEGGFRTFPCTARLDVVIVHKEAGYCFEPITQV